MKTTLIIETTTRSQIETMLRFLKEVGIGVSLVESNETMDWKELGLQEMEKEWNEPENDHWDKFLRTNSKA